MSDANWFWEHEIMMIIGVLASFSLFLSLRATHILFQIKEKAEKQSKRAKVEK